MRVKKERNLFRMEGYERLFREGDSRCDLKYKQDILN